MKNLACYLFALLTLFSSCSKEEDLSDNPLLQPWDTPYGVPPFDRIHTRHFEPAILHLIEEVEKEVERITGQDEEPTFENTIEPMEKVKVNQFRVQFLLSNLNAVNTNDSLQQIARNLAPTMSLAEDELKMNQLLFQRIDRIWEKRDELDAERKKLVEMYYLDSKRNGIFLDESDKEKVKKINMEISELKSRFGENIMAERNAYKLVIDRKEDLSGLASDMIETAKKTAEEYGLEGKWVFTLIEPSYYPFLEYADNRELRKELNNAFNSLGRNGDEYDNRDIILQLIELRRKKSQILNYPNHAHYRQEPYMLKNPEAVKDYISKLMNPILTQANQEVLEIERKMLDEGIQDFPKSYDIDYYLKKLQNSNLNYDENQVKSYFPLDNVIDGMFLVANRIYGLEFELENDIPRYHDEIKSYLVREESGEVLGVIYMDFHPRSSKNPGAWVALYNLPNNADENVPVVSLVCNFPRPSENHPSLLTPFEVRILFHEFGHVLHGLFSEVGFLNLNYHRVSWDFIELPSQIMENWARHPVVLKEIGKHHETGEQIDEGLIEKILMNEKAYNGYSLAYYFLLPTLLDLELHTIREVFEGDISNFSERVKKKFGDKFSDLPFPDRITQFSHIVFNHDAGYYSYLWSQALDADAFEAFLEKGDIFDRELAESFRREILAKGASADPMEMFVNFRGREPNTDALARRMGWLVEEKTEIQSLNHKNYVD
ncbi:M3 family metallopeptidase [Pleomorphovibrio marinus]|uniref:M3 family metallopeptidase n=1 Tax=Pleomorphovibrio marinus TaxID=2164132 RepID=UPI000E0B7B55|nr:M3 family metallopeptidase [Pleomorphovibrio marinus]